jgi:uncharacterized protein (DUF362 family)
MISNSVSLVSVSDSDLFSGIEKALELTDFKVESKVDSVIIKVNLCYYWDAYTGQTTDPAVVGALIDVLREKYGLSNAEIKIVEADATAMKTRHVFKMLNYEKLAKEKDVSLFNLLDDKLTLKTVNVDGKDVFFKVPESLLNPGLFINMPKIKITTATTITCALKNMFGCIGVPRKYAYHPILDHAIVGINQVLKPHAVLVDGLVALGSVPVKMDLIAAGANPLLVDCVAARIMGYNPSSISHLKLAQKVGIGNPKEIIIKGNESISELRKVFPHVSAFRLKWQNKMQLKLFKLYARLSKDVTPPFLETQ